MNTKKWENYLCDCGVSVSPNTHKTHLAGIKCNLPPEEKKRQYDIFALKTKQRFGWRVSEGDEAVADRFWYKSILSKESVLEDWVFKGPRSVGQMRPSSSQKMSENRKGTGNPYVKARAVTYDLDELKQYAKEEFSKARENKTPFGGLHKVMNLKFPNYRDLFADLQVTSIGRGHSKINAIIASLLDFDLNTWTKLCAKQRGLFISRGQLNSPEFLEMASRHGVAMMSKNRVTKPHMRLYEIVKHYDPEAVIEYHMPLGSTWKSFDIYSPRINSVIEMHGRVFHDQTQTKPGLLKVAIKNEENDTLKRSLAISKGLGYAVFWDDEEEWWDLDLECIYARA